MNKLNILQLILVLVVLVLLVLVLHKTKCTSNKLKSGDYPTQGCMNNGQNNANQYGDPTPNDVCEQQCNTAKGDSSCCQQMCGEPDSNGKYSNCQSEANDMQYNCRI